MLEDSKQFKDFVNTRKTRHELSDERRAEKQLVDDEK